MSGKNMKSVEKINIKFEIIAILKACNSRWGSGISTLLLTLYFLS